MQKIVLLILLLVSNRLFGQNTPDSVLPYKRPFKQGYFSDKNSPYRVRTGAPSDGVFIYSVNSRDSVFSLEKGNVIAVFHLEGTFIVIVRSSKHFVTYASNNASDTSRLKGMTVEKGDYLFSATADPKKEVYQVNVMISDNNKMLSYDEQLKFLKRWR